MRELERAIGWGDEVQKLRTGNIRSQQLMAQRLRDDRRVGDEMFEGPGRMGEDKYQRAFKGTRVREQV